MDHFNIVLKIWPGVWVPKYQEWWVFYEWSDTGCS